MKKLKKAQDEMAFILSASPANLIQYISEYPFRPRSEKPFVETVPKKVILLYIETYGLKPSAATVIFRNNDAELVNALLAWCHEDKVMTKTFLEHGEYHRIKNYVNDFAVAELPEQEALERFNKTELLQLIATSKLSPFAKYDILVRGDDDLKTPLIKKGGLDTREREFIISNGTKRDFELLISTQSNPRVIETMEQLKTLRFGKKREILALISRKRLHREAEILFLENAPLQFLVPYVKHYHPEGGDRALLTHPDRSEILNYLSKNWLCEEGEHLLLKRGEHEEIKAYIKSHFLNPEDEVRLIKRCRHREIMLYLSRHTLSAEGQIELIHRRNHTEICYLITSYPLSITEQTLETIQKCNLGEIIDLHDEVLSYLY